MNLPRDFEERMRRSLGDEADAFLTSMHMQPTRGIRLNPQKPIRVFPEGMGERIPWTQDGYYLSLESSAGADLLHEAGAYYLQDPGAMLPAEVLDAKPGECILDLCAAPGGKSTQIAASMQGQGLLIANEVVPKRCQVLSRNLERMGVTNAICTCMTAESLAKRWNEAFDAILVDAPCSGEGMFRKEPETILDWSAEKAAGCAQRQREILSQAAKMLKPGGRLIYATCTFNPDENEEQVKAFLDAHPEFQLEPFSRTGVSAPNGMFTCYPHRMRAEGQFVAKLKKDGTSETTIWHHEAKPLDRKTYAQLPITLPHEHLHQFGTMIYALPHSPSLDGLKVMRAGVHVGEMRGKVFVPDHALALACMPGLYPEYPLTAEEATLYVLGETLQVRDTSRGFVMVTYAGLRLGFGKAVDGTLKNHYPKGLRRKVKVTDGVQA